MNLKAHMFCSHFLTCNCRQRRSKCYGVDGREVGSIAVSVALKVLWMIFLRVCAVHVDNTGFVPNVVREFSCFHIVSVADVVVVHAVRFVRSGNPFFPVRVYH